MKHKLFLSLLLSHLFDFSVYAMQSAQQLNNKKLTTTRDEVVSLIINAQNEAEVVNALNQALRYCSTHVQNNKNPWYNLFSLLFTVSDDDDIKRTNEKVTANLCTVWYTLEQEAKESCIQFFKDNRQFLEEPIIAILNTKLVSSLLIDRLAHSRHWKGLQPVVQLEQEKSDTQRREEKSSAGLAAADRRIQELEQTLKEAHYRMQQLEQAAKNAQQRMEQTISELQRKIQEETQLRLQKIKTIREAYEKKETETKQHLDEMTARLEAARLDAQRHESQAKAAQQVQTALWQRHVALTPELSVARTRICDLEQACRVAEGLQKAAQEASQKAAQDVREWQNITENERARARQLEQLLQATENARLKAEKDATQRRELAQVERRREQELEQALKMAQEAQRRAEQETQQLRQSAEAGTRVQEEALQKASQEVIRHYDELLAERRRVHELEQALHATAEAQQRAGQERDDAMANLAAVLASLEQEEKPQDDVAAQHGRTVFGERAAQASRPLEPQYQRAERLRKQREDQAAQARQKAEQDAQQARLRKFWEDQVERRGTEQRRHPGPGKPPGG